MIGHFGNKDVKLKKKSQRKCFQIKSLYIADSFFWQFALVYLLKLHCVKSPIFVQKVDFEKNREFWWFFMSKNTHFDSNMQPKKWIFGQNVDF